MSHLRLRSLAFYEGGHALLTQDVTADAGRVEADVREAVSMFERRLTGLSLIIVVSRLEGVVVYRKDAIHPTGLFQFSPG